MNYLFRFDNWAFRGINSHLRNRFWESLMLVLTILGGALVSLSLCAVLYLINSDLGREALYALVGSHLAVQLIKFSVSRPRPFLVLQAVNLRQGSALRDYSFPSGHSAACFSWTTVLALHYPPLAPVLLILALLIGISRIYFGLHYPTDVFIGAGLGIFFAVITLV